MRRKILAIFLIIIGLFLFSIPYVSNFILEKNSAFNSIEDITPEEFEENRNNGKKTYDQSKINPININDLVKNKEKADMTKIIGQMTIPSIKKNLAIFDGLDNDNLLHGACTMKPNQIMGLGNFCLAGHYHKKDSVLFGGLFNVKIGDVVRLTNKKNIYEYRVFKMMKASDDRMDLLSDGLVNHGDGKPILSLMTCYKNETEYRYFVIAKFVRLYPYTPKKMLEGF